MALAFYCYYDFYDLVVETSEENYWKMYRYSETGYKHFDFEEVPKNEWKNDQNCQAKIFWICIFKDLCCHVKINLKKWVSSLCPVRCGYTYEYNIFSHYIHIFITFPLQAYVAIFAGMHVFYTLHTFIHLWFDLYIPGPLFWALSEQ